MQEQKKTNAQTSNLVSIIKFRKTEYQTEQNQDMENSNKRKLGKRDLMILPYIESDYWSTKLSIVYSD